jgi:hypothetical protein
MGLSRAVHEYQFCPNSAANSAAVKCQRSQYQRQPALEGAAARRLEGPFVRGQQPLAARSWTQAVGLDGPRCLSTGHSASLYIPPSPSEPREMAIGARLPVTGNICVDSKGWCRLFSCRFFLAAHFLFFDNVMHFFFSHPPM